MAKGVGVCHRVAIGSAKGEQCSAKHVREMSRSEEFGIKEGGRWPRG